MPSSTCSRLLRPARWPLLLSGLALACSLGVAQAQNTKAARFYEDALGRYQRGDYAGAIIQLKNALQQDKSQLPVQLLLGKALLANSDPAGAEVAFNEALKLGVNRVEVVVPMSQALLAQGKQTQLLSQALFDPAGLPTGLQQALQLSRVTALADTGDTGGALKLLGQARALNPGALEPWLAEVPLRLRTRQFSEAHAAADQALRLAPQSADAIYQKASILHLQGQPGEALALYDKALQIAPKHLEARLARAGIRLDQGRNQEALADAKAAEQQQSQEPRAVYLRALVAERSGDRPGTHAALQQITALIDPVPMSYIRYRTQWLILNGLAHQGLGEAEKAKAYLEAAQRNQGPSPIAKLLARLYLEDRNPDRAVEVLEAYLRVNPGDGDALTLLASTYIVQGRHSKAATLMREALEAKDQPAFRTVLGLALLRGGKEDDAVKTLEQSYRKSPRQAYAAITLVGVYLRNGQLDKAQALTQAMVKQSPSNPGAWLLHGDAKLQARQWVEARAAFERALQLAPDLMEAQLGLVRADMSQDRMDEAKAKLDELLRRNEKQIAPVLLMAQWAQARQQPEAVTQWLAKAQDMSDNKDPKADMAMTQWQLRQGQPAKALEAAKRMLAKSPEDPELLIMYAQVLQLNQDFVAARNALLQASRRASYDANLLLNIAERQLRAGDLGNAAYSIEKAQATDPNSIQAQALLTGIELQQGATAAAEKRAQQLVGKHPQKAIGHNLLADVALAKQQPAQALSSLKRAFQLEPGSATLLRQFSVQQSVEGPRAAQAALEAWLKRNPRDAMVWKALGDLQSRQALFPAAKTSYDKALQVRPGDSEALNSLANVHLELGDAAAAVKAASQAVRLDPGKPDLIDTLGWATFKSGQIDKALPLLRDARLRAPQTPEIRYHLGVVLAALGKKAEAREELMAALRDGARERFGPDAQKLLNTLQ
jgi:putative PEP-CTERM system TPR-repeat lipoprotein